MRLLWWVEPPKPRAVDNIGPDAPRILLRAKVLSHDVADNPGDILVRIRIADTTVQLAVSRITSKRLPVGDVVTFELKP